MRAPLRFGEILARVDNLSDRMLSQRLKELEAEGLVVRTVVSTTPVQVRYEPSDRGRELISALQPMVLASRGSATAGFGVAAAANGPAVAIATAAW